MSITKYLVIECDVKGCDHKTPLLDFGLENEASIDGHEEIIRTREGFSFLDVPFSNHKNLYICQKCLMAISGEDSQ